jgi:hypothetical protein
MPHQYAANHDQFPGWLGTGGTAQALIQPPQPEILARENVGKAAVKRAGPAPKTRPNRKNIRKRTQ